MVVSSPGRRHCGRRAGLRLWLWLAPRSDDRRGRALDGGQRQDHETQDTRSPGPGGLPQGHGHPRRDHPCAPAVASGIAGNLPVEKAAPEPVLPPVEPFYAVHFVSKNTEAIARFTLKGVDVQSAVPFQRPSIYPLNHIAVDPSGPVFYGITTHLFGRIDWATGAFKEVVINDPALPKLSWPAGLAFDSRETGCF